MFFWVFQLTALIVRGPATSGEKFVINLGRVKICEDELRGALLCMQVFVRNPRFTRRSFFSDSSIALLADFAAIYDSITNSAVFEPWIHVETTSRSQVVAEVCACVNQAVDRRRAAKYSQEQWYAVGGSRPSSKDSASRSGVRSSKKVEEGRVEYVPVRVPSVSVPGPSKLRVSSGKSKKKKVSRSPVKRRFEIASPPLSSQQHQMVENLGFSAALDRQQSCKKSRRSRRNRRVAPFFSRVDCHCWCYFVSIFENCSASPFSLLFVVIFRMKLFCFFLVVYIDIYVVE